MDKQKIMTNNEKFTVLRKLFNEVDPAGIFFEENKDEYDPEIKEFLSLRLDYDNLEEVDKCLRDIFSRYFEGVNLNYMAINELAKKVHSALQETR